MSKKVFLTAIFHSPLAEISNLALSAVLTFFHSHFCWLAKVCVRSEHPYRLQTSIIRASESSVPHSLSCVSLKCSHPVCIWGCDPQSLSIHKQRGWGCLSSPSSHISCRQHQWILVCLVHILSLWLARLTTKNMPLFPLLLLWVQVVVTQGSVPLICHHSCFGILHSFVVFCFCVFGITIYSSWSEEL